MGRGDGDTQPVAGRTRSAAAVSEAEIAQARGYGSGHQPDEDGSQGHEAEETFPGIFERPQLYAQMTPRIPSGADAATVSWATQYSQADRESVEAMRLMRGNPEQEITIYRALPVAASEQTIKPGEWVTLSETYARLHVDSESREDHQLHVVAMNVHAKDVRSAGDAVCEWGYFPAAE